MDDQTIEGWYLDPYGIHEQRWMSGDRPTSLVRDGGIEAKDEPPDNPPTKPLVPAPVVDSTFGGDLRRADDADEGPSPSLSSYADAAVAGNAMLNNFLTGGVVQSGPREGMIFDTLFERKLQQQARRKRWAKRWRKLIRCSRSKQRNPKPEILCSA